MQAFGLRGLGVSTKVATHMCQSWSGTGSTLEFYWLYLEKQPSNRKYKSVNGTIIMGEMTFLQLFIQTCKSKDQEIWIGFVTNKTHNDEMVMKILHLCWQSGHVQTQDCYKWSEDKVPQFPCYHVGNTSHNASLKRLIWCKVEIP